MTAIELLLESAIDYERTHQVILATLLRRSGLCEVLLGFDCAGDVEWEPEKGLFDLAAGAGATRTLIELKMWSSLADDQISRQADFLRSCGRRGVWVLLGTSWFERSAEYLAEATSQQYAKVGYTRLHSALSQIVDSAAESSEVRELAGSYSDALQEQHDRLIGAAFAESPGSQAFYYSLYWHLQQRLQECQTEIYTVSNRGGPVYILNKKPWHVLDICGVNTEIYYELVHDRLCLKCHPDTEDGTIRRSVRDAVRASVQQELGSNYPLTRRGRIGRYMTVWQVEHDFAKVQDIDKSAAIFARVDRSLHAAVASMRARIG